MVLTKGNIGLVATNTIAQGDTREVGLDQLIARGYTIPRAVPSRPWPGTAALEVAYVWLYKGKWQQKFMLNENPVAGITAYLTVPGKTVGNPYRLVANEGKSFQGSIVLGMGFVLEPEEAQALIDKDPKNKDVLFPYLNGQDLNSSSDQSPSRWVINFFDWPLDAEHDDPKKPKGPPYAADYPDCLGIVTEKVKPDRDKLGLKKDSSARGYAKYWWQYARKGKELYEAIAECDRVLAVAATSQTLGFTFLPTDLVFANTIYIFILSASSNFAIMMSTVNRVWTFEYCSNMRSDLRYSGSDAFETFPFPKTSNTLEIIGDRYYTHRQTIMRDRQEGLTKTYNHFHDPTQTDPDIQTLRDLHIQMDNAVAVAYGWPDLTLDHDFHETKQGLRFTISEGDRREVLDRLLALNHKRYAEEVAQGLHDKKKKKGKRKKKKSSSNKTQNQSGSLQGNLF